MSGLSALVAPAAATISGDGVSPAARAAASGSPPGSAAATASAEAGRSAGSCSRHLRITRSIAGSRSRTTDEGVEIVPLCCSAISSFSVLASYGAASREELEEHEAQRVEVGFDGGLSAAQLFGRHVLRRPGARCRGVAGGDGQAEVGDADVAVPVDHHVGRLEVAVEHAALVRGGEPRAQLAREIERLVLGDASDPAEQRRRDLPRPRTPSSGSGGRPRRRGRRAGRRSCATPGARRAARHETGPAARGRRRRRRAGTSGRRVDRASDRRPGTPRPCRRGRASRPGDTARQ